MTGRVSFNKLRHGGEGSVLLPQTTMELQYITREMAKDRDLSDPPA